VNDQHCALQIKLNAVEWDRSSNNVQSFIVWVKKQIKAGYPVMIGVYTNQYLFYNSVSSNAGDSDYDHIVPVIGIDSKYNDDLYHDDDIIYFSDNGESSCISAKDKATCSDSSAGPAQYSFTYTCIDFIGTRASANAKTGPIYTLPSSTSVGNYGIAHTGVVDRDGETVPITVTTNVNYEQPEIRDGSETRPASMKLILTVTISRLTPKQQYNLYKYDDETKLNKKCIIE
jgi:hypothetical protein